MIRRFLDQHVITPTSVRSAIVGMGALVSTLLASSPMRAAQSMTLQEAEAALQNCFHVSLGMSRSNAEHILGKPLSSEDNFLMFGKAQCFEPRWKADHKSRKQRAPRSRWAVARS